MLRCMLKWLAACFRSGSVFGYHSTKSLQIACFVVLLSSHTTLLVTFVFDALFVYAKVQPAHVNHALEEEFLVCLLFHFPAILESNAITTQSPLLLACARHSKDTPEAFGYAG